MLLLLGSLACGPVVDTNPTKAPFVFHPPHIIDSFQEPYAECNASRTMGYAGIEPLFVGPLTDTLDINEDKINEKYLISGEISSYVHYPMLVDSGLHIFVDTTQRVRKKVLFFQFPSPKNPKTNNASPSYELYEAFPVFMVNLLADTIAIGDRHQLPTVLEAMDAQGEWRPIERPMFDCGTDKEDLRVPPLEMVLAALDICAGDFPTQLRLRYNNMYSNSWHGSIYREQFGKK